MHFRRRRRGIRHALSGAQVSAGHRGSGRQLCGSALSTAASAAWTPADTSSRASATTQARRLRSRATRCAPSRGPCGTPVGRDAGGPRSAGARSAGRFSHYRHDDSDSARCAIRSSCRCTRTAPAWFGSARAKAASAAGIRAAGSSAATARIGLTASCVMSFADAPTARSGSPPWAAAWCDSTTPRARPLDIDAIVGRHNALGDQRVMSLRSDRDGHAVDRHHGERSQETDSRTDSSNPIPVKAGDPRSRQRRGHHDHVSRPTTAQIWIGSYGGGADVLDPTTGLIRQLPYGDDRRPGAISAASVTRDCRGAARQHMDRNGWRRPRSRARRTARWSRCSGMIRRIPRSMPSNTVYALEVDGEGRVWVATDGGGLAQRRRVDRRCRKPFTSRWYRARRGCRATRMYGVLSDSKGRLWLSGNAGLMRFDPDIARGEDLSPRAWPAGRGIRFQRIPSLARRPAVLRRAGRIQHLRPVAADGQCACAARGA